MIKTINQSRGSGKTTKVIELMKNDLLALCLVPNFAIKQRLFPESLQNRVISYSVLDIENIIIEMRIRGFDKLYIDELILSKFDIAKLFYRLGENHINVIVYGTDGGKI